MTAPNKNEGLIARLLAEAVDPFAPGLRHVSYVNPDGPEAARAIQDLEEEVGRLRGLIEPFRSAAENIRFDDYDSDRPAIVQVKHFRALWALASTADGGALRPSASVPAGAVIQGEANRQERRE